jgi:hypothetical protein
MLRLLLPSLSKIGGGSYLAIMDINNRKKMKEGIYKYSVQQMKCRDLVLI